MNILITGITGLLGSNLAQSLSIYHRVFGIDRNDFDMPLVTHYKHDVSDIPFIERILEDNRINILIHCVALTNMDYCERHPEIAFDINCTLTEKLAICCKNFGVKLIFVSTDAVYDGKKKGLNTETDIPNPVSVYGKSKLSAEKIVMSVSPTNLIYRTNFFGNNYRQTKKSFAESIVLSLRNGNELRMATDIFFSPIITTDIGKVVNMSINEDIRGIYNLGSTGSISKYDIALEFAKVFNIESYNITPVGLADIPFFAPRTSNMGLDNTKIKQTLHIELPSPKETVLLYRKLETIHRV